MYKNVLLVTDLEDDSNLVAARARWVLKSAPNAHLTVLHIIEDMVAGFGYELVAVSALNEATDNARLNKARERLGQILSIQNLGQSDVKIRTALSSHSGIIKYCQQNAVDLVIIGRHKRTGFAGWLTGSTVDNILPDIKTDVLIVHLGA